MCHCPRFAQAPRPPLCPAVAGTPAANLNRYVKSAGAHRLAHPAPIHTEVLRAQKPRSVQKIMYKSHSCREEDFSRMRKSKKKYTFALTRRKIWAFIKHFQSVRVFFNISRYIYSRGYLMGGQGLLLYTV